jgi:RNA polymerase sigma-70 factor (ECF subfamily)
MALMQSHTDEELIRLIGQDDEQAFRALYDRYWQRLLYFACQKIRGDMAEAENMVQDVFVSLWERRSKLVIKGSPEAYLVVSVKYRVIKWFNRQYTQSLYDDGGVAIDVLDDSTQEYLAFDELQERLAQVVGTLPEKVQLIYRLNKEEGMSHRQIAEELDMTETAVNVTLVRARKTLRNALGSFLGTFLL